MKTDIGKDRSDLQCMGCGKTKAVAEFVMLEILSVSDGDVGDVWRSRYCNGRCFETRYGDLIDKERHDLSFRKQKTI